MLARYAANALHWVDPLGLLRCGSPYSDRPDRQIASFLRAYPKPLLRPCTPLHCNRLPGARNLQRPDSPDQPGMPPPAPGLDPGFLHIDSARMIPLGPESRAGAQLRQHIRPMRERECHAIRPALSGCLY